MEIENRAPTPPTVFLLSPANLTGARAAQLLSPEAGFETAMRYRSAEGVPIAEVYSFVSSLYFRGKIAYARRFGEEASILVIAPGVGLVPPDWRITPERLATLRTPVDLARPDYCVPFNTHARELQAAMPEGGRVVLLGSVATGKYVDLLRPVFGDRLFFPREFAGMGDMQRGALMLRAAREGRELEYVTLDAPRRRQRIDPGSV
ncbi:MAG: hypothetical protein WAM82_24135 [Thermoanaerobaculia bacterium]